MQREFTPIVVHNASVNVAGTGTLAFYQPENPVDFSSGNQEGVRWALDVLGVVGTADSWQLHCKFQLGKWDSIGAGLSQFVWYDLQPEQIARMIFEGVDWYGGAGIATTYVNHFTNPTYVNSGGTDSAGTGGALATTTRPTSGGYQNLGYRHLTWSTATTTPSGGHSTPLATVAPGDIVSAGLRVNPSVDQRLQIGISWYNGATLLSSVNAASQIVLANSQTLMSMLGAVAPATATAYKVSVNAVVGTGAVNWQAGDSLDVTALMGVNGTILPAFFSGSFNGGTWTGTADASTSTKTIASTATGVVATSDDVMPVVVSRSIRSFGRFVRMWVYPTAVNPSSDFAVSYSLSTD